MIDTLKPMTKQWFDRQRRHHHNSFHGHATMCMQNMNSIERSDSTTPRAKELALQIWNLANELKTELKTRID